MAKYYAVKNGRQVGIFSTWPEAQKQVSGFSGAKYKSFTNQEAAEQYLNGDNPSVKEPTDSSEVIVYTDGGSRNTGNKKDDHIHRDDKSAWAYLIQFHGKQSSNAGGEWGATNNQMEITALLSALQWLIDSQLQDEPITVISDSHYVLDSITKKWLWGWQKRGWKTASGSDVKNAELWQAMLPLLEHFTHLKFKWTKGHAENEGNVFVDELLNRKMDEMKNDDSSFGKVALSNFKKDFKSFSEPTNKSQSMDEATKKSVTSLSNGLKKLGIDVNIK